MKTSTGPLQIGLCYLGMWLLLPLDIGHASEQPFVATPPSSWTASYSVKHPISGAHLGSRVVTITTEKTTWSIREQHTLRYNEITLEYVIIDIMTPPPDCQLRSRSVEIRLDGRDIAPSHEFTSRIKSSLLPLIPLAALSEYTSRWVPDHGMLDSVAIADRPTNMRGQSSIIPSCTIVRTRRCQDDRLSIVVLGPDHREIAFMLLDEDGHMTHEITEYAIVIRDDQLDANEPIDPEKLGIHERNLRRPPKRLPRLF